MVDFLTLAGGPTDTFQNAWYNANPDVAYRAWQDQVAGPGPGLDPYSRFVSSQYGRLYNQYQAALPAKGINYSFTDFLGEQTPTIRGQWAGLGPQQQGYNDPTGRLRWVL